MRLPARNQRCTHQAIATNTFMAPPIAIANHMSRSGLDKGTHEWDFPVIPSYGTISTSSRTELNALGRCYLPSLPEELLMKIFESCITDTGKIILVPTAMTRNPKSSPQPHTADEMPLVFTSTHSLLRTSKALRHSYARALKAATLAGRVQKVIVEVIGSDFSLARSEFLSKLDASSRALYNANTCNAAPYSAMPCITIRLNYIEGLRLPDRPANVKEWVEWCLEEKTAGREVFCSYRWCVRTGGDGYRRKTPALDWKSAGVS